MLNFFDIVRIIICAIIISGIPIINLCFLVLCRIDSMVTSIAILPPAKLNNKSIVSGIRARLIYFDANLSYNVITEEIAEIITK